jgi:hypothetical protein
MLADAKKSSRKYDGAYFFIEPHGMGESGPQISTVGRLASTACFDPSARG